MRLLVLGSGSSQQRLLCRNFAFSLTQIRPNDIIVVSGGMVAVMCKDACTHGLEAWQTNNVYIPSTHSLHLGT